MRDARHLPQPPAWRDLQASGPLALFLDFDGTLVDLAPAPDAIVVPVGLGQRLALLARQLEGRMALVSGRGLADIEHHTGPLAIARAGSHGSDCRLADGSALGQAPAMLPDAACHQIADFAQQHGFSLEEKPHGVALHYRHDPSLEDAGLAFAHKVSRAHGLAVKRGKCVIEFVAPGADKGTAVAAFMQAVPFADARPIFVGDDVTDEDGFAAARDLGGFGILVGDRTPTFARFGLADPAAVYDWLDL